jgi:hypothetical protein
VRRARGRGNLGMKYQWVAHRETDVDDESSTLVGAVGEPSDGAGEVEDVGVVVERDGDSRHLLVAVAQFVILAVSVLASCYYVILCV